MQLPFVPPCGRVSRAWCSARSPGWACCDRRGCRRPRRLIYVKVLVWAAARTIRIWPGFVRALRAQAAHPRNLEVVVRLACERAAHAEVAPPRTRGRAAQAPRARAAPRRGRRTSARRRASCAASCGDEHLVVVVDPRARLCAGWDALALRCPPGALLSCPAGGGFGPGSTAFFPTLAADGRRGPSRALPEEATNAAAAATTPAVCWCGEFSAGEPEVVVRGGVDAATRHVCPLAPLLAPDAALEAEYVARAAPARDAPPTARERVGLTREADARERIVKFGSTRAARLAVEFGSERRRRPNPATEFDQNPTEVRSTSPSRCHTARADVGPASNKKGRGHACTRTSHRRIDVASPSCGTSCRCCRREEDRSSQDERTASVGTR